ncbi:STAS domain-containing protein [Desulfuribacillus alkaliarsenatis]|uniref:Anti-sigma factor antagonist n=1 Tax=Desulfuribacillus alkaliarsenatis TaxID=766136 RepID=A0A1E5G5L6_9FIRM|nr:anti-sigma factor antagonist [Desulfuribacillus alkaliarsenatis]OEF98481.1 hypothetical protein BHF68_02050 [Desulfuribacillus alkaliarsenatis]
MNLQIKSKVVKNTVIFYLEGEFDQYTSSLVRTAIEGEWGKKLAANMILNMDKLTFMDSSGLGVILGRYKQVTNDGGQLAICCVNRQVDKIIELSGLRKIINFYQDEIDALKALGEE